MNKFYILIVIVIFSISIFTGCINSSEKIKLTNEEKKLLGRWEAKEGQFGSENIFANLYFYTEGNNKKCVWYMGVVCNWEIHENYLHLTVTKDGATVTEMHKYQVINDDTLLLGLTQTERYTFYKIKGN